jgi:hypothetical protein
MANKQTLYLHEMLAQTGRQFLDRNEDGTVRARELSTGKEITIDVIGALKNSGRNPDDLNIEYNTKEAPLDYSPVSITDRFKMGLGNRPGSATYLKKKFEDVATNENGDFVVKDKGAWHKVDGSNFQGDPWKFAKEFASELGENVSTAMNIGTTGVMTAAGGIAGGLAGTPTIPGVGTISGAAVGSLAGAALGGAIAKDIETSLGRIVGTYEATDEERLEDIGLEAIFSLGGQGLALAAKPSFQLLGRAAKSMWNGASDMGKAMLAHSLGDMTKVGPVAMETLGEMGEQVATTMEKAIAKTGGNEGKMISLAKRKQMQAGRIYYKKIVQNLPRLFQKNLDEMSELADDGLEINLDKIGKTFRETVEQEGLGRWVTTTKEVATTMDEQLAGAGGRKTITNSFFKTYTEQEASDLTAQGIKAEFLTPAERAALRPLVKQIESFAKVGSIRGKEVPKLLNNYERVLNKIASKNFGRPGAAVKDASVERVVTAATSGWRNGLQQAFEEVGLGTQWAKRASIYGSNAGAVRSAQRLLEQDVEKGLETLVQQLASTSGKQEAVKEGFGAAAHLAGKAAEPLRQSIRKWHAVQQFAPKAPRFGFMKAGGAATTSVVLGGIPTSLALPVAAVAMAASSPRAVMQAASKSQQLLPYARQGLKMVKSLPPPAMKQFLKNDAAIETWMRTVILGANQESQLKESLGQKLGIK